MFRRIPLLAQLDDDETFEIVRSCRHRALLAGETLFRQGDDGRSLFLIESGRIRIVLDAAPDHPVAEFGAREAFGELALISPAPRAATAIVLEDVVLYELGEADFDMLKKSGHPAAFKLIRALSRVVCSRIRAVNEKIDDALMSREDASLTGKFSAFDSDSGAYLVADDAAPIPLVQRIVQRLWRGGN
ncbi:MAG: CRP/FNR family cyclic AMP-dependent transcriptional regulator [Bradymonadia bacterium]|jgi:CRP/FNR family cyclic AMP-dependent transcriptional regulator